MNRESVVRFLDQLKQNSGGKNIEVKISSPRGDEGFIVFFQDEFIRFYSKTEHGIGYIFCHRASGIFDLYSDLAEKDISAQRISNSKLGRYVSPNEFFELLKIHFPYHFEWCLWNFI